MDTPPLRWALLQLGIRGVQRPQPDQAAEARSTACKCQASGSPLRPQAPRSSKRKPEPATRSLTVLETSASRLQRIELERTLG